MAPVEPPKCNVHGEPAKLYTVNKPGPNKGKTFFLCSRYVLLAQGFRIIVPPSRADRYLFLPFSSISLPLRSTPLAFLFFFFAFVFFLAYPLVYAYDPPLNPPIHIHSPY